MINKLNRLIGMCLLALCMIAAAQTARCARVEVVVSDGLTSNATIAGPDEILPSAIVYRIPGQLSESFARYILAERVEGLTVRFYVRSFGSGEVGWTLLGEGTTATDGEGRAVLAGIRTELSAEVLEAPPVDLQLRAEVVLEDGRITTDDSGLVRVLNASSVENPEVVFTDHDNTLHVSGGGNSVQDWFGLLNWMKEELPLVDAHVAMALETLRAAGKDIVIVTGIVPGLRPLCRSQVN